MPITIDGPWFKDEHGRTRILRGVNLSGSSKMPAKPPGYTHLAEDFFEHQDVSFVGRPFALEDADEHFSRLKAWGLDFLRFIVTWEAIEHSGPGIYDEDYLDYVEELVEKAYEYDIHLFIDPHQDVWSRFSGGDGAPGWTFDLVGMDITKFHETGAAIVHQTYGDPFPRMVWFTNSAKFATMTMFTLFFAGNDFAPHVTVDGVPIQDYLQSHYINAVRQVAKRVGHMPHVVGYDVMNEPLKGFIGCSDLRKNNEFRYLFRESPTPYQAMLLTSGFCLDDIPYHRSKLPLPWMIETCTINPDKQRLWKEGFDCLWREVGIWDVHEGKPRLLRPGHFQHVNGRKVDFTDDYYRPFAKRFADAIREDDPDAIIFIETEPYQPPPQWSDADAQGIVFAPHWYDAITLTTKRYFPFFTVDLETFLPALGHEHVQQAFTRQLGRYKQYSKEKLGNAPTLIGEIGIPYDMNDKAAYQSGDFSAQVQAMETNMRALEDNLLSYTLWTYAADNTNERGDQWNGEDLSIFSVDQQKNPNDINSGGRALEAVVRPYARAVAGEPLRMCFDREQGMFILNFRHDDAITEPTELFVPNTQFPDGYQVEVSDGDYEVDSENQRVIYRHSDKDIPHQVRIISNTPPPPAPTGRNPLLLVLVSLVGMWLLRRLLGRKD